MITRFLASWALFSQAYMTAWLIAIVLSLLGVLVVARDQIFFGAAVAQAATLGIAVAMVLGELLPGDASRLAAHRQHPVRDGREFLDPGRLAHRPPQPYRQ